MKFYVNDRVEYDGQPWNVEHVSSRYEGTFVTLVRTYDVMDGSRSSLVEIDAVVLADKMTGYTHFSERPIYEQDDSIQYEIEKMLAQIRESEGIYG